jgi:hypothetical protein
MAMSTSSEGITPASVILSLLISIMNFIVDSPVNYGFRGRSIHLASEIAALHTRRTREAGIDTAAK